MKPLDDPRNEQHEKKRDEELRERGNTDPGAAFTRISQERSWNTNYGVPPRPAKPDESKR